MGPANKLLDTAAAPTIDRIRRDKKRAPVQLQPLLAYLEEHLFDPDLDANQLKRACGVRDNSLPIYFHHALSLPPYAYIEDCRLEVACRLLKDSDLKVWQIAQLLGYSTLQVFSRAFDRWSGLRPSVFRRRARIEGQPSGEGLTAAGSADREARGEASVISLTTLRKAVSGGLEGKDADELARHLARLYPDSFRGLADRGSSGLPASGSGRCQLTAEEAWQLLESRPRKEQVGLITNRFQVASVELFEFLVRQGIEEVRRDTRRGVEIATLAVDCLAGLAGTLPESELRQREVKAYAWLANAHRIAINFQEAEKALRRGEESIRPDCDPEIRTEFILIKSAVRMSQRRMDESLKLADQVIDFLPNIEDPVLQARSWIHRAHVRHVMGMAARSTADLWQAHRLIDRVEDKYLHAGLYQILTCNLILEGRHQEAVYYLPIARSLCRDLGLERVLYYLEWTEGLVARDQESMETAEAHFRYARTGFYNEDNSYLGGLVALDLAILCALEGRYSETLDLAREVIEIFGGLKVRHEVLKAVQLLRQTVMAEDVTVATLRKIRTVVAKSRISS